MKRCQGCGKETNLVMGLGPVLLCRDECYPDANIDREAAQAAGQSFDITLWARRRYKRLHDNSTERVTRRNEALDAKAQALGFDGLSQMLTAWKNGEIVLWSAKMNNWERNAEIEAAAQRIMSEADEGILDLKPWKQKPVVWELQRRLVEDTGCDRATASRHISINEIKRAKG